VARLLDGKKPHLLISDPPYGVGYDPSWRNEANPFSTASVMTRNTQFEQIVSAVHSEAGLSIPAYFPRALSRLRRFGDFF
jgi:hypothetical protein